MGFSLDYVLTTNSFDIGTDRFKVSIGGVSFLINNSWLNFTFFACSFNRWESQHAFFGSLVRPVKGVR